MLYFTQNVINSWTNLVPASQNSRKWLKICKKQTMVERRKSQLSVGKGLTLVFDRAFNMKSFI